MASGVLRVFTLGVVGVDLVQSPIHVADGAWLSAKNAEFSSIGGQGGIKKRGGLSRLNSVAMSGGAVVAAAVAPFSYPGGNELWVALNSHTANAWDVSTDGSSYTPEPAASIEPMAQLDKGPIGLGGPITVAQRMASYRNAFFYAGDTYTGRASSPANTAPPIVRYESGVSAELLHVPANPTSTAAAYWISDLLVFNGLIYFSVWDTGGVAPNHKGRVFQLDPATGDLLQIGNRFGDGSGENVGGMPFCLGAFGGRLYAGTYGISGNNQGRVWVIQPGVGTSWTSDLTATLHNGYYMGLCPFQGALYAATDSDASGTAIVQKRTSTGTWSTSLSGPSSGQAYFCGLIEFNLNLFCAFHKSGSSLLIKKFDGTTWVTDLDVGALVGATTAFPGAPFLFGGAMYWPFSGTNTATDATGFMLKRTTANAWTTVLTTIGLRGACALRVPNA